MGLASFILQNMEAILTQWETFARTIQPVESEMSKLELRDHAELMLKAIAADLATPQTEDQAIRKSQGEAPKPKAQTAAQRHGDERLRAGFSIELMVSEYRALRASVLRLWLKGNPVQRDNDLTDVIRFNEAIDQALAESVANYAELVADSQDTFLGILGHDLRSPLQSVSVGAAYLMRSPEADSKLIQLGARMHNSANRMAGMLDDLLDYTKVRIGGGLNLSLKQTDLAVVALQVIEEALASHPGRTIRNAISGDCCGSWDGRRIGQVFQNLIGNALQYSTADSPIEVNMHSHAEDVEFCVRNEGTPIPEEEQRSLFDPLRRHVSTQPEDGFNNKNLGLGLYIARQVVVAHQGTIQLTSSAADGTEFKVTLPKVSGGAGALHFTSRS